MVFEFPKATEYQDTAVQSSEIWRIGAQRRRPLGRGFGTPPPTPRSPGLPGDDRATGSPCGSNSLLTFGEKGVKSALVARRLIPGLRTWAARALGEVAPVQHACPMAEEIV